MTKKPAKKPTKKALAAHEDKFFRPTNTLAVGRDTPGKPYVFTDATVTLHPMPLMPRRGAIADALCTLRDSFRGLPEGVTVTLEFPT